MSIANPEVRPRLNRWLLVRYVLGIVIGAVVLAILFSQRDDLVAAWHQLSRLNWAWALGVIASEVASVLAFSFLQRRVLAIGGSTIGLAPLLAISLANNAI